jgi:ankyrin repeat protein
VRIVACLVAAALLVLAGCGAEETAVPTASTPEAVPAEPAYPQAPGPETDAAWLATLPAPERGDRNDLRHAAAKGDVAATRYFAEVEGADLDEPSSSYHKQTAMHLAANEGQLDVVRYLVAKGADIDAPNKNGSPPLAGALGRHHPEVAEFLLARGADVQVRGRFGGALHYAAGGSNLEAARYLLSLGFDVNEEAKDYDIRPLCSAGYSATAEMMTFLIERGSALQEACGRAARSALHRAADGGNVEGARVLLDHGHDPNGYPTARSTPLHMAVEKYEEEFAELLLEYGADTSRQDSKGRTPLDLARERRRETFVALLQ